MLVARPMPVLFRARREPAPGLAERKLWLERECRWLERVACVGGTALDREDAADRRTLLLPELRDVTSMLRTERRRLARIAAAVLVPVLLALFSGIPQRLVVQYFG